MRDDGATVPQLENCYLHYTSREAAQGIVATGIMRPGRSGRVYLTRTLYTVGAQAVDQLSITGKPVEVALFISVDQVPSTVGPLPVEPLQDAEGNPLRNGGGVEFTVERPIRAPRDPGTWLTLGEI